MPSFAVTKVSDHHVKYSGISTGGLGGSADRSLGDYLQVKTGVNGEAVLSYVDDTSGNRNNDFSETGQTPSEASGPTMSVRQIAGPSLYTSTGSVGSGTAAVGSVTDPVGKGFPDAYLALAGTNTNSSKALDIAGVSITQPDAGHLTITMKTADPSLAKDLAPSPALGGLYANYRLRWAGRYGTSGKDGQIYNVGMQAGPDGTPEFYVGKTASIDTTRTKYYAYPTGHTVPGKITGSVITWTVPTTAVGIPTAGSGLFSLTGFTATSVLPDRPIVATEPTGTGQVGAEDTLAANQIDAAPSFSYAYRGTSFTPGKMGSPPPGNLPPAGNPLSGAMGTSGADRGSSGSLATTGLDRALPITGLALLLGLAGVRRRRGRTSRT